MGGGMNALAPAAQTTAIAKDIASLPALVDRAVATLANARTAAEVLEARERADFAYDMATRMIRLAKAKQAHDELISAALRSKGDALAIEAEANRRLADEYDAAQDRGEVASASVRTDIVPDGNDVERPATAAELGLSRKDIHEARIVRDAEAIEPGIVRRTIDQAIDAGHDPSKALVKNAALHVVRSDEAGSSSDNRKGPSINIPADMTASAFWRKGMKLEDDGDKDLEAVAKELGVGIQTYKLGREIVLLSDRTDLSQKDSERVRQAFALMDETRRVVKPHELIQPIAARIWGGRGGRRNSSHEARRVDLFENAITVIVEACEQGAEIAIPHLAGTQIAAAIKQVKQAEAGLRALRSKLEELRQ
jgi:hypothetical protein